MYCSFGISIKFSTETASYLSFVLLETVSEAFLVVLSQITLPIKSPVAPGIF